MGARTAPNQEAGEGFQEEAAVLRSGLMEEESRWWVNC